MACRQLKNQLRVDRAGVYYWQGYTDNKCTIGVGFARGSYAAARADFCKKFGPGGKCVTNPTIDPQGSSLLGTLGPQIQKFNEAVSKGLAPAAKIPAEIAKIPNVIDRANPFTGVAPGAQSLRDIYNKRNPDAPLPFTTPEELNRAKASDARQAQKCAEGDFMACLEQWVQKDQMIVYAGAGVAGLLVLLLLLRR